MMFWTPRKRRFYSFPPNVMEDQKTIGLAELLDEVSRDIDDFRKKHPNDYGIKGTTMWWELERERLLTRHGSFAAVKRMRQIASFKKTTLVFFGGLLGSICLSALLRFLIR